MPVTRFLKGMYVSLWKQCETARELQSIKVSFVSLTKSAREPPSRKNSSYVVAGLYRSYRSKLFEPASFGLSGLTVMRIVEERVVGGPFAITRPVSKGCAGQFWIWSVPDLIATLASR